MTRTLRPILVIVTLILVMAGWLLAAGRVPICPCGVVRLWSGVDSVDASQQIADWYTPSHIIHGLLFYAALALALPRLGRDWRLVIATAVEAGWEMLENSAWVIDRYREVTISIDYSGDSVLNSVSDVAAMILGFGLARVLPVWLSVALALGFEALTAVVIRDGLALNVLMLLWPLDAVMQWQAGLMGG